jgi:hypothetical protein
VAGIAHRSTLFLRTVHPIDFAAPDGDGVSTLLTFVVPADGRVRIISTCWPSWARCSRAARSVIA